MSDRNITTIKGEEITEKDRLLTIKETAEYCNIGLSTLHRKVEQFIFPPKHKISKHNVGFLKSDLDLWLDLGEMNFGLHFGNKLKQQAA